MMAVGVVALAAGMMYVSWVLLRAVPHLVRGVVSLFSWIAGFALGTYLFWKIIEGISIQKI